MQEIPIFFTIDDNYASVLAVALKSMMMNADPLRHYRIIVIEQDLSDENKDKLEDMVHSPFTISFLPLRRHLQEITDRTENRLRLDIFTLTIFYRIFIPDMFHQYDKAIYLDSDLVVTGDISQLYDIDLDDNYIGACTNLAVPCSTTFSQYAEEVIGVDRRRYFNSGVMLMNLQLLRDKDLSGHFLGLMERWHFDCLAPDQDYLNAMLCGRIEFLDRRWDAMPINSGEYVENPRIVHYNFFEKPWHYSDVMYGDYFWKYAQKTPYYQELQEQLASYTDAQRQADQESHHRMHERAVAIMKTDRTFKKLHESGEKIRL